jgi:hypothetical protein
MNKIPHKLVPVLALLLICSGLMNCEDQLDEGFSCNDSGSHSLSILPENPDSDDQILAIETICGSESDVILDFQGNRIIYKRYFNSLIMMPCMPRPDTTIIGRLDTGHYQLIQLMIDKNHLLLDSIALQDTICLVVR